METRRRLELIVERMAQSRAGNILKDAGIKGYTVLDAVAGYADGLDWQSDADISLAQDMVVIIAIGDNATIDRALQNLHQLLDAHIGVLSVSDVQIMRPERF